nr:pregnancy zone protein-like [Aedes albopictus]
MGTLIVLVCSVFAIAYCQDSSVIIFGPKHIQPRLPYTVALINPLKSEVRMNLTLDCGGSGSPLIKTLKKESVARYNLKIPDGISIDSECTFRAANDGGTIMVNHNADVTVAKKTLSIFILTDKPIYKPGDIVKFRVVVLDLATKPVNHIDSIQIDLENNKGDSSRQWTRAVLYKGIFEAAHRLSSTPEVGSWTIKVTAKDGIISNDKSQQFEVREHLLPKFGIKVEPSRILLISEMEIRLNIESYYTFGSAVRGNIVVKLVDRNKQNSSTHSISRTFVEKDVFRFELEDELDTEYEKDYAMVMVNVSLTEEFSNFTRHVSRQILVYEHPYKITLIKAVSNYRPNVPYHCKLLVKDHNGVPVTNRLITAKTDAGEERSTKTDSQGIATLDLPMPDAADAVDISVTFENRDYENVYSITGMVGVSTQYLQISLLKRNVKESTVSFIVKSNEKFSHLFYFVTSRGNILLAKYERFSNKVKYTINFKLTVDMTVQSKLLVYTLNSGQLIMDYFELDYFANEFEFSLEEYTFQPDQDVEINVKAEKDSYVAFQGIDQGALLLGQEGFGLTKEHVLEDLNEYTPYHGDLNIDATNSFGLFSRMGSNDQDEPNRNKRSIYRPKRQTTVKPILLRTDFPESWLWTNYTMRNHMYLTVSDVIPHTITSWYVTGFALSPTRGLGLVNAPAKLTVFKPFYIIANLPYSIKRNETVRIQVTLFNFLSNSLTTDVTLYNKRDEIEFVDQTSHDTKRRRKAIVVPYYQPTSVSFLIKAKKLGEIAIKIEAASQLRTDGLEHMLRVTPESRLRSKTQPQFINLPSHGRQNFSETLNIPRAADQGSVKIEAIVQHHIMGTVSQNLNNLFEIPTTGTGSFNLLTFIPNVVILDYIKEIKKKEPVIEQKAINYLSSGYKNQLKYKHSNGAFGQWDQPENEPSIFLTALVANAFSTASKHIEIDQSIITTAFSWIEGKQKDDGCFEEDGENIYEPMQNNASSFALTAFIVAAIKENGNTALRFTQVIKKATNCLADNFYLLENTHDKALATYALSLTGHANRVKYLNKLVEESHKEGEERYWDGELQVEIAGYALLSYLAQDMYYDAIPIMKWLNRQQYSTGAFSGVHSTFVALKALGKMAAHLITKQNDYTVNIRYGKHHQSFGVVYSDNLKPISHDLPDDTRKVDFEIVGIGSGVLQVTYQYFLNIQANPAHYASFDLDVNVLGTSTFEVQNLQVCLSYKQKEAYKSSGTTLVEVHLPSGLVFHENAVKVRSRHVKKTERAFHNTVMHVYYDEVSTYYQECFEITAYRKYQIALHRPAHVIVYDTNNMDKYAVKSYEGKVLQPCQICDREDCRSMDC